jgi:hypothetical protein
MEKREYEVKIKIILEPATIKAGRETAREVVETCGFLVKGVKYVSDKRTQKQNDAMHLWFDMLEAHCAERGLTMDALFKRPTELIITKEMLKAFFQQIGKHMYQKDHTSEFTKEEMNYVIKVAEKAFEERLDSSEIPFPNEKNKWLSEI